MIYCRQYDTKGADSVKYKNANYILPDELVKEIQ